MCFELSKKSYKAGPKTATEDIKVWKTINRNGSGWLHGTRGFWKPGHTNKIENCPFEINCDKYEWEGGKLVQDFANSTSYSIESRCFHSKRTKELAEGMYVSEEDIHVHMIIPKGALYYENDEEYVSNELYYPLQ